MRVYENKYTKELKEKYITTIMKKDIRKSLNVYWNKTEDFVEVFELPYNSGEINSSFSSKNEVRIGCLSNKKVIVWDGDILHHLVESTLNVFFDLALIYEKDSNKLVMSGRYCPDIEELKDLINTDDYFKYYFKMLKSQFTKIKYLDCGKKLIKI